MPELYSAADAARETFQRFMDLLSGKMGPGIYTGFERLDSLLYGLQAGKLIVLAARPSTGKTAYALNLIRNMFHKQKTARILYFSLDLDHVQLMTRLLCMESGLKTRQIQQGDIDTESIQQLSSAATWIKGISLWIYPSSGITVEELDAKVRKFSQKHQFDLIIIDSLELLKHQEPSDIKKVRQIAREFQLPILLLSTCHGEKKQYQLQELSKSIEDNSDTLIFLEQESLSEDQQSTFVLKIVQNTCGFTGSIPMEYDSDTMTFEEVDADKENS